MHKYLKYLIVIISFIIVDIIAIRTFIIQFYQFGVRDEFLLLPAIIAWIIIPSGLIYFVKDKKRKLIAGPIYGFVVYGVYALTTYAVVDGWYYTTMFADMIWGPLICYFTTILAVKIKAV